MFPGRGGLWPGVASRFVCIGYKFERASCPLKELRKSGKEYLKEFIEG